MDDRLLDPTGDSASHRLAWVLRLAQGLGWATSFYGVRTRRWFTVDGDARLSPSGPPDSTDVVWIVRPEAGSVVLPALSSHRPELGVVYDSMDLHHLRLARERAVTGSRGVALQGPLMRSLERLLASHADVVVAISDEERDTLARLAGDSQVAVLPNIHQPREDEPPPLRDRSGLVFVGNFSHTPNVDAVEVVAREIMPRLWRQRSDLVLSIVGRGFPENHRTSLDPRIVVRGWVEHLDPVLDGACLLVAPLRFGAGLKGKIGYAFARGLPVVTTPCGAEGFPNTAAMAVAPEGDWDAFADATLELLLNEELWSQRSEAGVELTRREFAPTVLASRLQQILDLARQGQR